MSTSICSFAPDSQQRPSSSTQLEIKKKPKMNSDRIVNSDLHLSLSGQTSMLMLTRKHEYSRSNNMIVSHTNANEQAINTEDNNKSTKNAKSTKQTLFEIGDSEEENKIESEPVNYQLSSKYPPTVPFKFVNDIEDCSCVLEFFDPNTNDKRRANKERLSRFIKHDTIGFRSIQQQLKSFNSVCTLKIGGRTTRITLKNIKNLDKIYSQLILHNYHLIQRPRKKPLHEFYKDQEEAELEGLCFNQIKA
jgi:hypothetical protein